MPDNLNRDEKKILIRSKQLLKHIVDKTFVKILLLVLCTFLLYKLVFDFKSIMDTIGGTLTFIANILGYFLCGFVIAFVLNPAVVFLQKRIYRIFKKSDEVKRQNISKLISVAIVYLLTVGFFIMIVLTAIPIVTNSINDLKENYKFYIENLETSYNGLIERLRLPQLSGAFSDFSSLIEAASNKIFEGISFDYVGKFLTNTTNGLLTLFFGFILSIYMHMSKDSLKESIRNISYALLSDKKAEGLCNVAEKINRIFSTYIIGVLLDSAIIGIMSYIGFILIKVPYAPILSIIVGITNMVPYFGPLVGFIIVEILLLLVQPNYMLVIWALLIVFVLQQADGWVIKPKIFSNSLKVSPILIIAGLTIGGSIFGFWGMLIGVPIVVTVKEFFYDGFIMNKIKKKRALKKEIIACEDDIKRDE